MREENPTSATERTAFERHPRQIGHARRYVRQVLAAWGFESEVDAVELAASELVSNAVCHGSGRIELELVRLGDRVRLEVRDEGSDGSIGPVVRDRPLGALAPGGWGLRLVDQVSERWGVAAEKGQTRVWMETGPAGER